MSMKDARWVHLACHGRFVRQRPSQSGLLMADEWLSAQTLIEQLSLFGCDGVILSACEVGRSAADGLDPLGMSGVLLAAGVRSVLAPLWPINDISATLFVKLLYSHLRNTNLGIAMSQACRDIRGLTREQAIALIDNANDLESFPGEYPFRASIYWACYQAHGAAFHNRTTPFSGSEKAVS